MINGLVARQRGPGVSDDRVAWLNGLGAGEAERELRACCAAPSWVAALAAGRPYTDLDSLLAASDDAFVHMSAPDLSAALAAHPRIGEPGELGNGGWSRQEQAGAAGAHPDVLAELADGNREYEKRFGHVFLICATGLSADDMLAALRTRLGNDPGTEEKIVVEELRKIAAVRLRKLLGGVGP